jgi:dTDP-4-dehydrorhamnose 3,5-epimerase
MEKIRLVKNINGIKLIKYFFSKDSRGSFSKIFSSDSFKKLGFIKKVSQINISSNLKKGTIRGFHYQKKPKNEQKIIICIKGEISDIAIDIRTKSKNFLKTYKFKLSSKKNNCLLIPEGFAHGFQSLTDNTEIIYIHSELYDSKLDTGINPFDKNLKFNWPIKVKNFSKRDELLPKTNNLFRGVNI